MKKELSNELSAEQLAELTALAEMPDDKIDLSDAPEVLDWSNARRGLFFEAPTAERVIRIDADVMEWFHAQAKGKTSFQSEINQALRQYVTDQSRKAG